MRKESAKILIIGAGSIGTRHVKNLWKLGFRNLAICDPDAARRNLLANLFPAIRAHKDFKDALQREKPAVVFVCSPTDLHVPQALAAVRNGADVFIEKPLSHSLSGTSILIREAERRKRIVMVACNWQFHPVFRTLQASLRKSRFGRPILARLLSGYYLPQARPGRDYKKIYVSQKVGGGVILDSGSHALNYLQALFGEVKSGAMFASASRELKMQAEEAASGVMLHASGVKTSLHLDYLSRKPVHRLEVITSKGVLDADFREGVLAFDDGKTAKIVHRSQDGIEKMFMDEVRHFLDCVQTRRKPRQDLKEARRVVEVLLNSQKERPQLI